MKPARMTTRAVRMDSARHMAEHRKPPVLYQAGVDWKISLDQLKHMPPKIEPPYAEQRAKRTLR